MEQTSNFSFLLQRIEKSSVVPKTKKQRTQTRQVSDFVERLPRNYLELFSSVQEVFPHLPLLKIHEALYTSKYSEINAIQVLADEEESTEKNSKKKKLDMEEQDRVFASSLLDQEKKDREIELEKKLYTCEICFMEYKISEMYTLDECSHRFCFDCLQQFFHTKIVDGEVSDIRCPQRDCAHTITYAEVKHVVDKTLFGKYEQFLLKKTLEADPYVRWCPKPSCENAMIGSPNNPMMVCTNPDCKFTFCFNCREEWHGDATCEQYQEWKKENSESEQRFQDWTQHNAKSCPSCKSYIEKNGGCNHMTCRSCNYQFCWLCYAKYDSNHWNNSKCKQYS